MTEAATIVAWVVAVVRMATGVGFLVAPERPAVTWVGSAGVAAQCLVRAVGGRDLVIGAGLAWALVADADPLPWLVVSTAADVMDAASGAAMLENSQREKTLLYAGGFAVIGIVAIGLHLVS